MSATKTCGNEPPKSKSELKRERILLAASQLFCQLGFSATSMDNVAQQAGVSKQTVYSHFGNKDELFKMAVTSRCEAFQMSAMSNITLDDAKTTLNRFSKAFMQLLLSDEGMAIHRICIFESQTNPHISQLFFSAGPEPIIAELTRLLSYYHNQGVLVIDDCHCAAIQLLSMLRGEAMMRKEYNTPTQLSVDAIDNYLKHCVQLFLTGYQYKG
ncbi:TetR/AcrR family transcriptional regulator [Thalassotalea aquiviva]|uniref:TetR/AcrR family transcriptional regulator n=1 Tax=Thalassotalea aquiviva TaxID=3242415 RepID=UPI00352ABF66